MLQPFTAGGCQRGQTAAHASPRHFPGWPLIHLPLPSPPDEGIAMKPEDWYSMSSRILSPPGDQFGPRMTPLAYGSQG